MPVCRKCNNAFPNVIKIQNRQHILSSRKFCLTCSPFGLKNRKQLDKQDIARFCLKCNRSIDHRRNFCHSCYNKAQRLRNKQKALEYKGGRCNSCGYNKSIKALQFHHQNPEIKLFTVSGNTTLSWDRLKQELDKCILLCANCHAEEHEFLAA